MPLGYALVGPVADAVGLDETMFAATGIVVALALAALLLPDIRRFGRPHVGTPASPM